MVRLRSVARGLQGPNRPKFFDCDQEKAVFLSKTTTKRRSQKSSPNKFEMQTDKNEN